MSETAVTHPPYRSIGIYGLGLIGASLARTIRRIFPDVEILAFNRTPGIIAEAYLDGVLSENTNADLRRLSTCDLIFLCAPPETNLSILSSLSRMITSDTLLTDVSSVKGAFVRRAEALGLSRQFIGGHPMAGSERTGYAASSDRLLENAFYLLTPAPDFPESSLRRFEGFLRELGAIPRVMTCVEHDAAVAAVSHLPHVTAAALVNVLAGLDDSDRRLRDLAAGGFRDITRIASSSPALWEGICLENASCLLSMIERMKQELDRFSASLSEAKATPSPGALFEEARDYRDSLPEKGSGLLSGIHEIYCDVEDEAGAIATIATILAVHRINLKNIGIVHNREFQEGVLRIETESAAALEEAVALLEHHHYVVHRR